MGRQPRHLSRAAALTATLLLVLPSPAAPAAWGPAGLLAGSSGFFSLDAHPLRTLVLSACVTYAMVDCVALISQGEAALVERLGRYDRQLRAGLHFKWPVVDRVAARWSIRERVLDVPPQRCISADNAPLTADAVVFYRIEELYLAKYAIDDFEVGLQNLVLTQLRAEIGRLPLDATFSAREQLNAILLREANAVTRQWGVVVTRVDVRDIQPSAEILRSMELQLAAERKKRAAILESEGDRQATINAAEAKQAAVVFEAKAEQRKLQTEATGVADAIDAVARALSSSRQTSSSVDSSLSSAAAPPPDAKTRRLAADFLLERQLLAAHRSLALSPNTKILSLLQPHGGTSASSSPRTPHKASSSDAGAVDNWAVLLAALADRGASSAASSSSSGRKKSSSSYTTHQ